MYTPHSLEIALLMMIATAICWGSWANTFKGVKNYRFELFYWDYAIGIFLISVVLAFTMGSTSNDSASFLNNVRLADGSNIIYTLVGGAVFNLANLLLVAAIDMAGLAIAFPVSIGIALVVGVIASYLQQPKGSAGLLAIGVACAVIAVIMDGKAYGSLAKAAGSASKKSIATCIVSGVLMGLWSPFVAHAMSHGKTLGPYSISVFLTLGALLSCFIWNIYFMKKPLVREPVNFSEFFRGGVGPCSRLVGRGDLGKRNGVQFSGWILRSRHLLRHWPISANGGRTLGNLRLERISRSEAASQDLSRIHVRFLFAGDFACRKSQYCNVTNSGQILVEWRGKPGMQMLAQSENAVTFLVRMGRTETDKKCLLGFKIPSASGPFSGNSQIAAALKSATCLASIDFHLVFNGLRSKMVCPRRRGARAARGSQNEHLPARLPGGLALILLPSCR